MSYRKTVKISSQKMTINYFINFLTAVSPGHKICQLRDNNHRLRSGVARGECDNTLERTLHITGVEVGLSVSSLRMPSYAPCLQEADTRIFARATKAAKRPNKKICSCAVDTDVVVRSYLWCNTCEWMNCGVGKNRLLSLA